MFPFLYAPTFQYPLSGNVFQDINPEFTQIAGIPEVETEVVHTVASYGKQLGKLTEAVLALAEKVGLEGEEIEAVRAIAVGVEEAKGRALEAVKARAERARGDVERLGRTK